MHKLASSFILGYHGCDKAVAERLLGGKDFRSSQNNYDWLGPGIYFWEANPVRGLEFAREVMGLKRGPKINTPAVVGAVVELGLCLDLTTSAGVQQISDAHQRLVELAEAAEYDLPKNNKDLLQRNLDCAVIRQFHDIRAENDLVPVDTVRGVFLEGGRLFENSGFYQKTHIQVCVRNAECIKGVFRVSQHQLS